jgi:hypothetical protein
VLARTAHDLFAELNCLTTLAMAAVALHAPSAGATCRDALSRIYDLRVWVIVWPVIETVAGSLATA